MHHASSEAEATPARIAAAVAEVARLVDAVAEMGLSDALKCRLKTAEVDLQALRNEPTTFAPFPLPDRRMIEIRVRKVMTRIETELAADVDRARKILAEKLGRITVEERENGVYAQMDIGPVLLEAAGADVAGTGCGGAQTVRATQTEQGLSVAIVVRVGDRMKRYKRTKA